MESIRTRKNFTVFLHAFNGLALLVIIFYGAWFISSGTFPSFHHLENYYVNLSQAFLKGQVALLDTPDPRLAELSNTHQAPGSGIPFLWDVSYYRGKYYIYWGPAPAVFYMLYTAIKGAPAPAQLGVLAAYILTACVLLAILYLLRYRFYPRAPLISIGIFLLVACINPPMAFLLSRPLTYETAILTGQLFLFTGLMFWLLYLIRQKRAFLLLAGMFWGLAVMSRYTTLLSVGVFVAAALLYFWITRPPGKTVFRLDQAARNAMDLGFPLAVTALAVEIYNTIRFGSPLETGLGYQLTTPVVHYYSPGYVLTNLYLYLFTPNPIIPRFPFVTIKHFVPTDLPNWESIRDGKQFDFGFFGLFHSTPIFWFMAFSIVALLLILYLRPAGPQSTARARLPVISLQVMLLLSGLVQLGFLLFYYYSAVRFMADFYLPLLVGGFLLLWELDCYLQGRNALRAIYWAAFAYFSLATSVIGFFSGFALFPYYFSHHNVPLYIALENQVTQSKNAIYAFLQPEVLPARLWKALFH